MPRKKTDGTVDDSVDETSTDETSTDDLAQPADLADAAAPVAEVEPEAEPEAEPGSAGEPAARYRVNRTQIGSGEVSFVMGQVITVEEMGPHCDQLERLLEIGALIALQPATGFEELTESGVSAAPVALPDGPPARDPQRDPEQDSELDPGVPGSQPAYGDQGPRPSGVEIGPFKNMPGEAATREVSLDEWNAHANPPPPAL